MANPSPDRHDPPPLATTTPGPMMPEPEVTYTIRRLLDRRVRHGVMEYLCWWAGHARSHASWETAEAVGDIRLIIAYELEQRLRDPAPRRWLADRIRDPSLSPTSASPNSAANSPRYSPTAATFGDASPWADTMQVDTALPLTLAERIGSPARTHRKMVPHVFLDKVGDYLWIVDGFTKMSALVAGDEAPRYVADFYVVPRVAPFVNDDGTQGHRLELLAMWGSPHLGNHTLTLPGETRALQFIRFVADILRDEVTHASVAYFADDVVIVRVSSPAPMITLA
ncbi:hypothetical protein AURDEDRAFT_178073 [Auricularia subglabra TFB-10046 SS5]|uniref:Chromo domain-containing protein n=1 Tax=Auricularia subglabra (strain TFB-10046 / SS5) TaxID=717982 RepID=J0WM09_AURST|nr:hypothetical protein AURDEDRAFT_178073 [Auricularia subglabra TFB-10046 SS5]